MRQAIADAGLVGRIPTLDMTPEETPATEKVSPIFQWTVAVAFVLAIGALARVVMSGSAVSPDTVHLIGLLIAALATYAWVLYPIPAGVCVGATALIGLTWAWASRKTFVLGLELSACSLLLGLAVWQRHRWVSSRLRIQQVLEDLGEERTVKEQAIALAKQTREALQRKLSRYTQLQTIAEELANMTDLSSITQLAVDRAFTLIGKSDVCLLFLLNQDQQELSLFASKRQPAVANVRAKHGDQFDRYVLRTHRPLLVNDIRRDFRFTVTVAPDREISSIIACPLLVGRSPEGVLRLDSSQAGAYTQDDLRFLDILLDLAATAVTNAKLFVQAEQLAMTDGLTGLTLRRPLLEQLTRELSRSGRSRESVSILMVDVDHFKRYNDAFGHTAGDLVLKSVAQVLRTAIPPGGVAARYGGEEFVLLLPRTNQLQASQVAEKIRRLVEQSGTRSIGDEARAAVEMSGRGTAHGVASLSSSKSAKASMAVTVSLGVATFPDDAQAELELIRVADQRLYQAKHSGRNLVCSS